MLSQPRPNERRFKAPIVIALILLTGVILRFTQMGEIRYTYDQSFPTYQALALLDGGIWPIIGQPSSVFLDNPVLMTYLQALPLLLIRTPWAVHAFILILNSAAVWFVWRIATDFLGRQGGWAAALLFAVNPWIVFFSRTTWVQSLVPFLMAVIAWGLWPIIVEDRPSPRRFLIGGIGVTLLTQTYIQAWGVLPQISILLMAFRQRVPRREFWLAAGLFATASLLYLLGLLTRTGANSTKASNFLAGEWQGFSSIGLRHGLRFVNGIDFRPAYAAGNPPDSWWPALSMIAVGLITICFAVGVFRALSSLRHVGRERRVAFVLLTWFFIPVLLTSVEGPFDIHPHYLMLTLPAGQLLAAWGIAPLLRGRFSPAMAATLLIVGIIFAHDLYRANELVGRNPTWPEFGGWSLAAGAEVGQGMRDLLISDAGPYPRRIVAAGDKEVLSGLSATYVHPVREATFPDFVLLPAGQPLLYIIDGTAETPARLQPFFEVETRRELNFVDGTGITLVKTRANAAARITGQPAHSVEWSSEAGLTLVGYTVGGTPRTGEALEITTYWRVDEVNPEHAEWYVSSNYHLIDGEGNVVSNISEHGQWAYRWEPGDVYIEHITVPVPNTAKPGNYHLDISLFDSVRLHQYLFDAGAPTPTLRIPVPVTAN